MAQANVDESKKKFEYIEDRPVNDSRKIVRYKYNPETDALGEGGFGKVFKVVIDNDGKEDEKSKVYALKQLPKAILRAEKERKLRALTEIRIHRQLLHKNICKFEHSFEDKDNIYILLEYCPNQSLQDLVHKRKLKEFEVRFYMFQVLQALQYLRRQKIVHRDLTLANIFLFDTQTVKLGDFGLSFKETENYEKGDLFCGTEGYVAPETASYKFNYKTDIFAFGVCIYTLLTGKSLFPSSPAQTGEIIEKGDIPYDQSMKCSAEARDLLGRIFQMEAKRIDIDDIYKHPFFNYGKGLIGVTLPVLNPEGDKEANCKKFQEDIDELSQGVIMKNVCVYRDYLHKINKSNFDNEDSNGKATFTNTMKRGILRFSTSKDINKKKQKVTNNLNATLVAPNEEGKENKAINLSLDKEKLKNVNKSKSIPNIMLTKGITAQLQNEEPQSPINFIKTPPKNKNSNNSLSMKGDLQSAYSKGSFGAQNFQTPTMEPTISSNGSNGSGNHKVMNFEKLLEMEYSKKNNLLKESEYLIIDYIDVSDKFGIGYQMNSGDVAMFFNDRTTMLKLNTKANRIIYHFLNPLTQKEVVQFLPFPLKKISNDVDKKIKLLNTIQKELQSRKNEEIPPLYLDSNFEGVIMKKWKKTQQMYIFLLSNKNIQCLFYDKSQVIFFCGNNRKMKYINEDGKEDEFICDNFTNLRCEDENVKKKIEAAIAELKK